MSLSYTNEKLTAIIHQLITGEDEIVPRLREAVRPHALLLGDDGLSKQTSKLLAEIKVAIKKDRQEKSLTVEEAVDLSYKLLQVWQDVQQTVSERRG